MIQEVTEVGPRVAWTSERKELHALLRDRHADLAALYKYAIDIVSVEPAEGERKVRDSLVGHCLRELMNNFDQVVDDVPGQPIRERTEEGPLREDLLRNFEALGDSGRNPPHPEARVIVTGALVVSVANWARAQYEIRTREDQRDSVAVLGRIDENDPSLRPWKGARRLFMKLTHLNIDKNKPRTEKSRDDEIELNLSIVEASLRARLGAFFATVRELDDLLAIANGEPDRGAL